MKITWQKLLLEIIGYSIALILIIAALFVSVVKLVEPVLNNNKAQFEKIASRLLEREVTIQKTDVIWEHFEPELGFTNVMVLDKNTQKPALDIPQILLNLQIWQSIFKQQLIFESLKVIGLHITLHETKAGVVDLNGFGNFSVTDNFTGQSVNANVMLQWIFAQPFLFLQDISVQYFNLKNVEKSVTLRLLELRNTKTDHVLKGDATLNQDVPTRVKINVTWQGDDITDFSKIDGKIFLHLENLSFPQWFSQYPWRNLQIVRGMGNANIWAEWKQNSWQNVRASLQFDDIKGKSLRTKKILSISHLSGKLKWRREGASEIINGEEFSIVLPEHSWPTQNFSAKFTRANDNTPILQALALDYLDLGDADELITASGLLPDNLSKWLTIFDPIGEIHGASIEYHGAMDDVTKLKMSAELSAISFNAWNQLPGLNNFHGFVSWDGIQGNLKIDSPQIHVTLNKIFADTLVFDQLTGNLGWQNDKAGNWILTGTNLHAKNNDIDVSTQFVLNFPLNESPVIDLKGSFSVAHAERIIRYLPAKIFARDLDDWLRKAFIKGQVTSGTAILAGHLNDFPFDHRNGQFVINATVNAVDLNFAPGWPVLQKINGQMVFSGRNMKIKLSSAEMLEVPLQAVDAEIPYLGDAEPQVLNVTTNIVTDSSTAMDFIHRSPLQKTLGQDLSAMQLQGPMKLKLGLSIPLSHADDAKVQGDTQLSNATVSFPEWNLQLNKVNGAFKFTEDSVNARNISGELFAQPFSLSIATQTAKNKSSVVTASLTSQLKIADLQTWLALPIDQYLQGETKFRADLTLPGHSQTGQATQILIHSDLQGVKINLPANYGKAATEKTDFSFLINSGVGLPLKLKLFYGKLFSAAATLAKQNQKTQLVSGDFHLGNVGSAEWQTQPGVVVTGNLEKVDWNEIQPYITQLTAKKAEKPTTDAMPAFDASMLRGADITIHDLVLPGMQLNQIRIQLTRNPNSVTIGLSNAEMAGQIIYPFQTGQTIQAKFQHLNISTQTNNTQSTLTPNSLPPISFVGEDVRYGDAQLGRVMLNLTPGSSSASIHLSVDSAAMTLRSVGTWQKATSHLQGNASTKNIGKFLESLGFAQPSLVGSSGNADFDLTWQGSFFQPSIAAMSGKISIKLGEGRVINLSSETNAEMGFGRMLNIFSLQSIPRRLSLDFSDLFEKGYNFDIMTGDFTLKNGNAYTQNTRIDGPVARVDLNGRLGIAAKDYDLKMEVTPYVTASLPVITTIATVNPVVGIAAWVADKIVSRGVSQLITYQYTITGPWSNPVWTKLGSQKNSR